MWYRSFVKNFIFYVNVNNIKWIKIQVSVKVSKHYWEHYTYPLPYWLAYRGMRTWNTFIQTWFFSAIKISSRPIKQQYSRHVTNQNTIFSSRDQSKHNIPVTSLQIQYFCSSYISCVDIINLTCYKSNTKNIPYHVK